MICDTVKNKDYQVFIVSRFEHKTRSFYLKLQFDNGNESGLFLNTGFKNSSIYNKYLIKCFSNSATKAVRIMKRVEL